MFKTYAVPNRNTLARRGQKYAYTLCREDNGNKITWRGFPRLIRTVLQPPRVGKVERHPPKGYLNVTVTVAGGCVNDTNDGSVVRHSISGRSTRHVACSQFSSGGRDRQTLHATQRRGEPFPFRTCGLPGVTPINTVSTNFATQTPAIYYGPDGQHERP